MQRLGNRYLCGCSAALTIVVFTPAAAQRAATPAPTVTSVTTNVSIGVYRGRCPARLQFTAVITAATVPKVPITYQWIRSDNAKSVKRTARMTGTSLTLTDKWTVGRSGEQMRVWEKLQVLSPTALTSNQADAAVLCN